MDYLGDGISARLVDRIGFLAFLHKKIKMNQSQIYTAQEILSKHNILRDALHACFEIIPDD